MRKPMPDIKVGDLIRVWSSEGGRNRPAIVRKVTRSFIDVTVFYEGASRVVEGSSSFVTDLVDGKDVRLKYQSCEMYPSPLNYGRGFYTDTGDILNYDYSLDVRVI